MTLRTAFDLTKLVCKGNPVSSASHLSLSVRSLISPDEHANIVEEDEDQVLVRRPFLRRLSVRCRSLLQDRHGVDELYLELVQLLS